MGFLFKSIFLGVILNGAAFYVLTKFVEGINYSGGVKFFVVIGLLIGIINAFIKPIISLLALPLILLTGGLVLIVLNGLMFWFLEYFLDVAAFQNVSLSFENLETYVIGGIVFGIINWILGLIFKS